jgi:hypothetical protein
MTKNITGQMILCKYLIPAEIGHGKRKVRQVSSLSGLGGKAQAGMLGYFG